MKHKWRNRVLERGVVVDRRRGYVYVRYAVRGRVRKELMGRTSDVDVFDRANWRAQYLRSRRRAVPTDFEPKRKRMLVEDAADIFVRLHGQKRASVEGAKAFARYMQRVKQAWAGRPIDSITGDDMRDYRAARRASGLSESTINREHTAIITLFNRLAEWRRTGQIPESVALPDGNPGRGVRKVGEERFIRNRILTDDEYARLWGCADETLRRIILAAMNLPLRLADLKQLSKRSIDAHQSQFKGVQVKTNREYALPINARMWDLIRTAPGDRILDFTGFQKRWQRATRKAGLHTDGEHPLQFRDLRRTAATALHDAGVPLRTVSAMLGHSAVTTTIRYLGLRDENLKMAGDTLAMKYQRLEGSSVKRDVRLETVPESVPTSSEYEATKNELSCLEFS